MSHNSQRLRKRRPQISCIWFSNEMVQMHGGIGMTDEHDAGLYLKRARVQEQPSDGFLSSRSLRHTIGVLAVEGISERPLRGKRTDRRRVKLRMTTLSGAI